MSTTFISMEKVKQMPPFLGEKATMKIIHTMPGKHTAPEGTVGFFVIEDGFDQNLPHVG
ncbi:hypothetical protein OAW23_00780 [Flavobacteriales bacterium]|nr:hypothetical protein [Flavobacteriales bacterium]MDC3336381.1 hypothetical protein [Flavobacteriales bacterium]